MAVVPAPTRQVQVELQIAGGGEPAVSPPGGLGLTGLAAFTLDEQGRVVSWPVAASALFGLGGDAVIGRDVRDVLLAVSASGGRPPQTPPTDHRETDHRETGHRELVDRALAEIAAGRVWTATLPPVSAAGRPTTIRCEPLGGPGSGALVTALLAPPGPGWLSEAATRIGSSLDLAQTAREVTEVAVPGFAAMATIFVPERMMAAGELAWHRTGHPTVVRRLAARLDGQSPDATDGLLYPGEVLALGDETASFRAMADRGPVVVDRLDLESAQRVARRPGGREFTGAHTSYLAVPLIARGTVVGCAVFGRTAGSPAFGQADAVAAGELASRAAVCLDNARLYDRERRTAAALQRGLLPGRPRVPPGLEVAHRYMPVGDSVVGGDWHDIVPLPGGRAALIVGDAMGHGPEAAAVMVQLRTAAHVLADLDLPPGEVLSRLDKMAAGLASAPFAATCIYTIIDPSASSCEFAQAGHHPPLLVLADGTTQVLDLPPGLPLGLGTGSFVATRIGLPPGATLALYTDGLVESRTRPLDQGMAALRDALGSALARPRATLGSTCATVSQALRQQGEDDITLVLTRIRR
jgi:serine phosphatase RsbU (regulator of sigma subunit)